MHKVRDEVDKPAVSNDDSRGDRSSMQKRVTVHSLLGGDGANPISRGRGSERRRCHSVQVILMRRGSAAREEVPCVARRPRTGRGETVSAARDGARRDDITINGARADATGRRCACLTGAPTTCAVKVDDISDGLAELTRARPPTRTRRVCTVVGKGCVALGTAAPGARCVASGRAASPPSSSSGGERTRHSVRGGSARREDLH
jgi:hypothetical protein